jgi:MerR family mercuric resistance operon transcriptional regulator
MAAMTIAKLARASGVGVETIRYYQRRGLLLEPPRPLSDGQGGGYRHYGDNDVRRVRFIKAAQAAGFTLEEIGELLTLDGTGDRARAREMARVRITALDLRIAELERARDALRRLERTCRNEAGGPCPILASFDDSFPRHG